MSERDKGNWQRPPSQTQQPPLSVSRFHHVLTAACFAIFSQLLTTVLPTFGPFLLNLTTCACVSDFVLLIGLDSLPGNVLVMSFSLSEYAEMHYFYGVAQGNASEAARLYKEQLQRRGGPQPNPYPDYRVFINTHNTFMAGQIPGRDQPREGVPRSDPDLVEVVLEEVHQDPGVSTRSLERRLGIPKSSVHDILTKEAYHPYHIQRVQGLLPTDYPLRVTFCQTMLNRQREDPDFFNKILWTDESRFERLGVFNIHNYHSYARENPHSVRASNFQHRFSVNMWSGVLNGELIGPFELPSRVDGDTYKSFLENDLPLLLQDVNLELRRTMIFQNDGAPCHYATRVRNYLNEVYPNRWIGRSGPISWPPRSPDLNPIDFFIWGFYKEIIYAREVSSENELREKIHQAENDIRTNSAAFRNLQSNFLRRCRLCISAEGRHFENLL